MDLKYAEWFNWIWLNVWFESELWWRWLTKYTYCFCTRDIIYLFIILLLLLFFFGTTHTTLTLIPHKAPSNSRDRSLAVFADRKMPHHWLPMNELVKHVFKVCYLEFLYLAYGISFVYALWFICNLPEFIIKLELLIPCALLNPGLFIVLGWNLSLLCPIFLTKSAICYSISMTTQMGWWHSSIC